VAVPGAPTVTLTSEPERAAVKISVAVPAGATSLAIWRVGPSGVAAYVRGWQAGAVSGGSNVIVRDYEAALDVSLSYYAAATNSDGTGATSAVKTITIPSSGNDWLCDLARPANSRPVLVESLATQQFDVPHGVHRVLSRRDPVVASDVAWTWGAELRFVTLTDVDHDGAHNALGNGVPVLLKTPPERGVGNAYLSVESWNEGRISRIATRPERRFVCAVVQVQRPSPLLYTPTAPLSYAEMKAKFATYAALKAQRASYDAAIYDYTAADPEAPVAWLPEDV
jgi:hypothetical protein